MTHHARALAVSLFVCLVAPGPARAQDDLAGNNHGRIDLIHLNGIVEGRGPCVQMKPSIPGKSAWACLWRENPLYVEIRELLQGAFTTGKRCIVYWEDIDPSGHKMIDRLECWRT